MRRRMVTVLTIIGVLALPSIAHAGCTTTAGPVTITQPAVNTYSDVGCTSGNGAHYELRIYIQADDIGGGGFQIMTAPVTYQIYNPPTNYSHRFNAGFGCAIFAQSSEHARNKSVLENIATGSLSISYGPSVLIPIGCQ